MSAGMLDMNRYVPGLITHLSNKLSRGASALYRERYGIGIIEWRIIAQLGSAPGSTARAICDRTALDKSAVSRSFVVLQERGLVAFAQGASRREQRANLTAAGRKMHERIAKLALSREERFLAPLSADERAQLVALLSRLYDNVDAVDD